MALCSKSLSGSFLQTQSREGASLVPQRKKDAWRCSLDGLSSEFLPESRRVCSRTSSGASLHFDLGFPVRSFVKQPSTRVRNLWVMHTLSLYRGATVEPMANCMSE